MPKEPNGLFNNRYLALKELGHGGFGKTYLAVDTHLPSKPRCVVKQLTFETDDPDLYELVRTRFQREAAVLETLGNLHQQIPRLHACSEEEGRLYLVQDWIEGESLQDKAKRRGAFGEAEVRNLLARLLPVVEFIHSKNVIHRDIKPDNIMIRKADGLPYLIDFGAVKEVLTAAAGMYGDDGRSIFIGTPPFAPLEQHEGRPVFASDLYSLGLTAICLLTDKPPAWRETDLSTGKPVVRRLRPGTWYEYAPGVGERLRGVLDKAIQPAAADRHRSAREMLGAMRLTRSHAASQRGVESGPRPDRLTGLERLTALAKKYDDIRAEYQGQDTAHRRALMNGVLNEMIAVCLSWKTADVLSHINSEEWGLRLAAYVHAYAHPRAEDLPALLTSIEQAGRQPFVQHRGIEAVGKILEVHGRAPEAVAGVEQLRRLLDVLSAETLRYAELRRILQKFEGGPAGSGAAGADPVAPGE